MAAFDVWKGPCGAMCTATSAIPAFPRSVVSEIARACSSVFYLQACEFLTIVIMRYFAASFPVSRLSTVLPCWMVTSAARGAERYPTLAVRSGAPFRKSYT